MKYAVIDIGSNSVRLSAYRYYPQTKSLELFLDERATIGLAAYVKDGILDEVGIAKLAAVLKKDKALLHDLQITHYYTLATASIRNVKNTDAIIAQIDAMTGLRIHVLSGEQEAKLDFRGVLQEIAQPNGIIIDIGGGSTEIISFEDGTVMDAVSLPIGSLQLTTAYVKGIIPTHKERKAIKRAIDTALDSFVWANRKYPVIYGIGGTCRCALRLSKELYEMEQDGQESGMLPLHTVGDMLHTVKEELQSKSQMPLLKQIYRTVPERMFSVIPGLIILNQIAQRVHAEELTVCQGSLREGYLYQYILK